MPTTDTGARLRGRANTMPPDQVMAELGTGPKGLSDEEARRRLTLLGPNTVMEVRRRPLLLRFLANFTHFMALLLWAGGIIGFMAGMPQLGVAIWMVNLINGAFSFWMEYRAEKALAALQSLMPSKAMVVRDGDEKALPARDVVPGDIVLLGEGDRIPADGRVIEETRLRVDQSTLTGESRPVDKNAPVPGTLAASSSEAAGDLDAETMVFAGTTVAAGEGRAVVLATGMETEFGRIAGAAQSVHETITPLQRELARVTRLVSFLAVGVGVAFFLMAAFLVGVSLGESFIFALGIIVAFVPEGLLPTVTLSLAMGVRRMAERGALIKRLASVETLGSATVICTDKTGTLTENQMTVASLWTSGRAVAVTGLGYSPHGRIAGVAGSIDEDLKALLTAGVLCSSASLPNANSEPHGDPTEIALLVAAVKGGLDVKDLRECCPRLLEIPFESERKRMSTVNVIDGRKTIFAKGAPDIVTDRSESILRNGREEPLDATARAEVLAAVDGFARQGMRVLALASRHLPGSFQIPDKPDDLDPDYLETELTFLGLAAMLDPPRQGVLEAIGKCHTAGIRIIMITGDHALTAESIARNLGIVRDREGTEAKVLTGRDIQLLDDGALNSALAGDVVVARGSPADKLRIVKALQASGEVVAMTGDGVNDAPALKQADIGVAMGRSGSDAARAVADMVLVDDHFASIVQAVEEGRAVFSNIRKFITYIFTSNAAEAVPFIVFVLSFGRIPLALGVMLVLAVDLGTDMLPALALGAEPVEPGLMAHPPRSRHEHVVTRLVLLRSLVVLGLLEGLAAMGAFYWRYWTDGYGGQWIDLPAGTTLHSSATAMAFGAVVMAQVGNLFAQRSETRPAWRLGFPHNRLLWIGLAAELAIILLVAYMPFFQSVFGTASFGPTGWLVLLATAPLLPLADGLMKRVVGRKADRSP